MAKKAAPLKLPKPRPRPHTPAADVRTGRGTRAITSPSGSTFLTGGHPGNTGGKKGRSGRKSKAFKELCRRVIDDPRIGERIELFLFGEHELTAVDPEQRFEGVGPKEFVQLVGLLASYVEEKPKSTVAVERATLEDLVAGSNREGDGDDHEEEDE